MEKNLRQIFWLGATKNMRNTFFFVFFFKNGIRHCGKMFCCFFVGAKLEDIPGKCGKVEVFFCFRLVLFIFSCLHGRTL